MDEQISSPINGGDRIGALPDEIISIILSKLPVEESARTSILSKRWPKMWLLSPITISDEFAMLSFTHPGDYSRSVWIVNAMSYIISTHPGPIHTCYFDLCIWNEHRKTFVELLETLTQKGIQNLQIVFNYFIFEVPRFVLECKSLVEVKLVNVSMRDQLPACRDVFPNVRKLTMADCDVSDEFLVKLTHLKWLVELRLNNCYGFEDVVIESNSLQNFFFLAREDIIINLIVQDAPNLKSFKYHYLSYGSKLVISNAPKLKDLRYIDMKISMLQLGTYRFKFHEMDPISGEITYMPSLRSLNIVVDLRHAYEAKLVPHFLMCFPCLETLELEVKYDTISSSDDEYEDKDNNDNTTDVADDDDDDYVHLASNISCLNHHLKKLKVSAYSGSQSQLDFIKPIIANAVVLETVTLLCHSYPLGRKWMEAQRQCLMQDGASEMLQVNFCNRW